jgi:RNA polymerase sigma-70 factor (ECF subfamily)
MTMADDWLAAQFEDHRGRLRSVAFRMLGSVSEADDAVQETWLRLSRADAAGVDNLGGWLTTVLGRVCLDMLRARTARREEPLADQPLERAVHGAGPGPEHEALMADSVGLALLVVLDALTPPERLAFVLHDLFGVPFEEIAPIVDRSPAAARQLASRARRRVQGADPDSAAGADHTAASTARRREIVRAFLAASRDGDFEALLELLDPDVVLRADEAAVRSGAAGELRGALAVAEMFRGRARAARPALVDGSPGLVWLSHGEPRMVFAFTIVDDAVVAIDLLADPDRLAALELTLGG